MEINRFSKTLLKLINRKSVLVDNNLFCYERVYIIINSITWMLPIHLTKSNKTKTDNYEENIDFHSTKLIGKLIIFIPKIITILMRVHRKTKFSVFIQHREFVSYL